MGLALTVDDFLPPVESVPTVPTAPAPPKAAASVSFREALGRVAKTEDTFADFANKMSEGSTRVVAAAESLCDTATAAKRSEVLAELGNLINELRDRERVLAEQFMPDVRKYEEKRKIALRSNDPLIRGQYAELLAKHNRTALAALESLRDCRLKLAEIASSLDTEADSPIFESDEEISRHIDSL